MSMEADLTALLQTVCTRVYPDVAPPGTPLPYATYQHIGGESLVFLDNTAPDKRNTLVQINVWSARRAEALVLARWIEDLLHASPAFTARAMGGPLGQFEASPEQNLYGTLQRFSIWAAR